MYLSESDPTHSCLVSIAPVVSTELPSTEVRNTHEDISLRTGDTPLHVEKKRILGRYLLKRCLGRGTAGSVWSAEDIEDVGREVALKIMHADVHDEHAFTRYSCEVRAMVRMDHPHIARIWEYGKAQDGKLYIAMELVQGPQLTKFCETCHPTIEERI
ncbi:MAG TPA: protein kinase, partial [Gemmatales bacterium]|nr:protein kinase [Gemmatales bacterium]